MALPTNSYRPQRYYRSKFREGKFLLSAEATDIQLESFEQIRQYVKKTYGDIALGPAFRVDIGPSGTDKIVVRPGEAWLDGIPFVMKSGSDSMVIEGSLPTDVSFADLSQTTSDVGGKQIIFDAAAANDNYSVVIEAIEEIVKEAGSSGAIEPYLEGVNVGEGSQHKFRLNYKIHVTETANLTSSPIFAGVGLTDHFVNEIEITPGPSDYNLNTNVAITPDINGADKRLVFEQTGLPKLLPFANDADDYIFGKLIDSDGNSFTITSITTATGGDTVEMLIDREVQVGSINEKPGLPIITTGVPYKLVKRDHFTTDTNGTPLGRKYFRIADFTFTSPNIGSIVDVRTVAEKNSWQVDHSIRIGGGGFIAWEAGAGTLTHDADILITIPGVSAVARIEAPPGLVTILNDGEVAYILLDRNATSDYAPTVTIVDKEDVPSNVNAFVIMERQDSRIFFPHNGSIGSGETGVMGAFGSTLDKDLSELLIIQALTENRMDEVFAETFNSTDLVDLAASTGITFEIFNKQFRTNTSAVFADYTADTLPAADPTSPWVKLGTQSESVAAGVLTLTDNSAGDRIAYERVESSLVPLAHSDHSFRLRMPSPGTSTLPFTYELKDGASGKHFGIGLTGTEARLIDGSGSTLQSFTVDTSTFHTYRLVKLGNLRVQWYVDNVLRGAFKYSDISTGSGGDTKAIWGTSTADPSVGSISIEVDFVNYNIFGSIFQSFDLFRQSSVFYNADDLPAADPTAAWTKNDGGGGITETIVDGKLELSDSIAGNQINYERTESKLIRKGAAEIETRVSIDSGSLNNFDRFGVRMRDGVKDVAVYIRDDGGQLKVGMYNGASGTLVSNEFNIDGDIFVVIKLKKLTDVGYQLYVDGAIKDSNSYDEFTDSTADNKYLFGDFVSVSEYDATIDYVQYALAGDGTLAATPVTDFLTIVNGDDPFTTVWISTDNGLTWYESIEGETTSISDLETAGGNVIARIGLSAINSVLTDYGVLYNLTAFDVVGQFEYSKFGPAVGGETVITLPFTYTTGINELQVHYRPAATSLTRKLTLPEDYTEPNGSQIELTFPLLAGDFLEFRNSFTQDPIVPPPIRFLNHDHDGTRGESTVLNPTEIHVSGVLDADGAVEISGTTGHSVSSEFADEVFAQRTSNIQISPSSGVDSTASATMNDIANLDVTITTIGHPVLLKLISANISGVADDTSFITSQESVIAFVKDGAIIASQTQNGSHDDQFPPSMYSHVDVPAAGTYTYKMQWRRIAGTLNIQDVKLVAIEL